MVNSYNKRDVAVIGIGFRVPSGNSKKSLSDPYQLFDQLLKGFDGILETKERWSENYNTIGDIENKHAGLLPFDELKSFDPLFFGINPAEASTIDPQQRLLLKCVWEALEDSGIDPISLRGSNVPVYVGASTIDYHHINKPYSANDPLINIFNNSNHSCANRISYCFNLFGESITIDTACSSSLNAINLGYNSIINDKSKISICGGVNITVDPNISKAFSQMGILSKTGRCHSFSEEADGYVRSEGAGIVVLKSLEDAVKDGNQIYCIIKGSSSNVDGNFDKLNLFSPSKSKQCDNIKMAIKSTNGQIEASDIDYVEAHATGTPTGDPIEAEGIAMVFKDSNKKEPLLIGSIKSNIGHGEASSGVISLVKCCLMFKNKTFVPNINFKTPNSKIKFQEWNLKVVTEPIKFQDDKVTTMAINNFGVTGSNCCLILQQYNSNHNHNNSISDIHNTHNNKKYLVPFSANSPISLNSYKSIINQLLVEKVSFNNFITKQIQLKSKSLVQRSVIIASNWDEYKDQSNEIKLNSNKISNITNENKNPVTVFIFCGQGSQYNKMFSSLYENEPIFKKWVDKFDMKLANYYGYSILDKLRSVKNEDLISIHEPLLAQPANIMMQVSLFELYKHWGIKPDIIVGHSLGEVSSSYCSGMIDFETLCYLTYYRSVAQNKTTGSGRMLSLNIGAEEFNNKYLAKYPTLEIACYNSSSSIVVVGKETILNELMVELKSKEIFCAMLGSLSSFHSSSQLVIKDEVLKMNIESNSPTIPVWSTVTNNQFDSSSPFNQQYVFDNILQPVNFTKTISNIYNYIESNDMGNQVTFIEIAPHPTLQYYLNQMKSQQSDYFNNGSNISVFSSNNKKKNDYNEFIKLISILYVNNGFNSIDFNSQLNNSDINPTTTISSTSTSASTYECNLPLYQFDESIYYKIYPSYDKVIRDGPSINHLGNESDSPFKSYQTSIDIKKLPFQWLKGHSLEGKTIFPGTGYIDNIFKSYPNKDLTINNLEFKSPLILKEGINQILQTTIDTISKNEYSVKFHYKDSKTNQWILSAIGSFSLFNHGDQIKKININQLKEKCNYAKLSKDELYQTIKITTGLNYTGLFKGVKETYFGNSCSLSIISLKEIENQKEFNHLRNSSMDSFFNPAILDTTLQSIIGTISEKCKIVFDKVDCFKYYSSNIPSSNQDYSELYVYCQTRKRENQFSISGSVHIMLPDGTLLIEISNVVCTSLIPMIENSSILQPSSKDIFTPHLQSIQSPIDSPQLFKSLYDLEEFKVKESDNKLIDLDIVYTLLYQNINSRVPNINLETLSTYDYQDFKLLFYNAEVNINLFNFIYECLIKYLELVQRKKEKLNLQLTTYEDYFMYNFYNRTTRILAKIVFPILDDDPNKDTPQELFQNGLLDTFYNNTKVVQPLNKLLGEIVKVSIKPLICKPILFRILEAGGGVGSLSIFILEKLNQLLIDNPSHQIDIEYTWTDISSSFFAEFKEKVSNINGNINIIYKELDLDQNLDTQGINSSYYDLVVMSNVLHVCKDLKSSLNQLYNILKPNGQLIYRAPI